MKKFIPSFIVVALLLSSCAKDADTATTELSYSFSAINMNASLNVNASLSGVPVAVATNSSINWTSVSLNVAKVEFSAKRAGSSISLESKNLYSVNALKPDSLAGTIPLTAGVYEDIHFKLTMNDSSTQAPLILNGTYIEQSGTKIPVVVQLNAAQLLNFDMSRYEIVKGKYIAKVSLELNALAKGLTPNDFGQTTRTGTNNTIVVTSTQNRALYEKLVARIPSVASISIVKP